MSHRINKKILAAEQIGVARKLFSGWPTNWARLQWKSFTKYESIKVNN